MFKELWKNLKTNNYLFHWHFSQLQYYGFHGIAKTVAEETGCPQSTEPSNELAKLAQLGTVVYEGKS